MQPHQEVWLEMLVTRGLRINTVPADAAPQSKNLHRTFNGLLHVVQGRYRLVLVLLLVETCQAALHHLPRHFLTCKPLRTCTTKRAVHNSSNGC
jgi:hypothetical protein